VTRTLRADPRPVRRWFNPGEPGWRNAQVRPHRTAGMAPSSVTRYYRGFMWWCPNHPETKSGSIRGIARHFANLSREEAMARLHEHFRRYHDAP
jgi:hypothetical protein